MKKIVVFFQSITIFLLPTYILRFYTFFPTTILEVFLLLTIFLTFFEFLRSGFSIKKLKTKYDFPILIFLSASIFSVFTSYNFIGGLGILKAYFIEPVLFYYCLVFTAKTYGNRYITKSLIAAGIWVSLLGLLQKLTGSYSLAPHEIIQGRISGVYNSANSLALFLGPIVIISLMLFLNKKSKFIYGILFIFFMVIIFWTKSRGGMIALTSSFLIFLYSFLVFKNKFIKKIWFIAPLILLAFLTFFSINFYQTNNFIPADYGQPYTIGDTLQIRYFIWLGTINMLKDHPLFGAGLNGFKTLYTNQYRLLQYQEEFQYPHNLFLTFWTETGILGLFAFILLMVTSVGMILKKINSKEIIFGTGFLAILSYLIIHGMVDVPYFKNDLSVEFWIILALIEGWSETSIVKNK